MQVFYSVKSIMHDVLVQVILVGHSSGGACVSYAMEHFPKKISKAVFVCATMVSDGQRPFDVFAEEVVIVLCLFFGGLILIEFSQ